MKNRTFSTPRPCLHGERVTLVGRLPFKEGYPLLLFFRVQFTCQGRVTVGGGSPYLLGRAALLGGLTFYQVKARVMVKFSTIGLLWHSRYF